jgi:protein-S-isoprenylcysteine O-methyltransferase Ste14
MYQFSRHPMYLATFIICFATGIATVSCLFIVISILIMLSFHFEALVEERHCLEKYKSRYKV